MSILTSNTGGKLSRFAAFLNEGMALRMFFFVTFAFIFVFHTYPLGLSDFWWHINTGRWIWIHGELPVDDPLLYTSVSPLDIRASQILRGYALFQLMIFGAYTLAGFYALVVLKGLLMTLFYGLLWLHLRRNGLHSSLALAIVGALPLLFFRFDDFRPQIFTFVAILLVLLMVERRLANERNGIAVKWYEMAALPLIMFLWANLHGGFIIGLAILTVYLAAEWFACRRGINALSGQAYRRFRMWVVLSMGAVFLNPVGISAVWSIFDVMSGPFSQVIDEYFGTTKYFAFHGAGYIGYLIVAMSIITAIALFAQWRNLSIPHFLLLVVFLTAGILSFRFSLLMAAIMSIIASAYFSRDLNRWMSMLKGVPAVTLWCISMAFLANSALERTSLIAEPLEEGVIPAAAAQYLAQSKPSGNIFNHFEYGGYLSWQLYPQKMFIDQRSLSWDVYEEYSRCWRGDYSEVFRKYQIGVVLYHVHEGATRKVSRLVARLFADNQWGIGYYDGRDIIFVRKDINAYLPYLDRNKVVEDIVRRSLG